MKRLKEITGGLLAGLLVCSFTPEKNPLDRANVVAQRKKVNGSELIVADYSALKSKEIALPLSMFAGEMQIVKLDNREEALVGNSSVTISENYILVGSHKQNPCKLFDKKGNFIATVGAFGQGPGEYQNIYDLAIDEKEGLIYILGWTTQNILVYDLQGKFLKTIPTGLTVLKGKCWPDAATPAVSVAILASEQMPAVAYTIQPDGSRTGVVKPGPLAIPVKNPFNNEVFANKNTAEKDLFIFRFFDRRPDSLYHYDAVKGKLYPKFTVNFPGETPIHSFIELPGYFMGDVAIEKKESEYASTTQDTRYFLVDKQTLKGAFFTLVNDYMGGMEIKWPVYVFNNGYYAAMYEPGALKEMLSKFLTSHPDLPETMKAKLNALEKSIDENDNNYLFYAKLKK